MSAMNLNLTRMEWVQTPIIPVVAALSRENSGTISLGQGVVSYGPPPTAIAQISEFLSNPLNHRYQSNEGIPPLLTAIATKLKTENEIELGDRQVVVTAGSNMGFLNALLAVTAPGDEVILQVPYYFNHEMAITIAGCQAVCVPTDENYQLRLDSIRGAITERTRAIVTISPNNPTGVVYPEADLREVNAICQQHGLYHIHDEAYEYFTYEGVQVFSPGSIPEGINTTISLYSLSKAYGFASWRIGYMVIPAHLQLPVLKIQDTNVICPPVVSQYAALGALEAGRNYCQERLGAITDVRQRMLNKLQTIADICTVPSANGAFYFLVKVHTSLSSMDVVEQLVRQHRVAVLPGSAFGMSDGCYLRVAYGALGRETALEGIERLITGLRAVVET